jgi:hypothetical protein
MEKTDYWASFSDATITDTSHWLWGMTAPFIESIMKSHGWKLIHKEFWRGCCLNPQNRRYAALSSTGPASR